MPRVVLDPNVLVSALITPHGASARLLVELRAGAFELVTSPKLLGELAHVLRRPKFRRYVTEEEAATFVELIDSEGSVFDDPPQPSVPLSEDPGDDYLLLLARACSAHMLVSGDPHLLQLASELPIMSPAEFLRSLERAD